MKQKFTLLLLCLIASSWSLWAQRTITGKITDADSGEPLIGASVLIVGTTTGTVTDFEGNYSIQISDEAKEFEVSYTGYAAITIPITNANVLDIELTAGELLGEVVVSALGFVQRKDELGSTASVVGSDDVVRSGETGVINGLSGKAAGVRIIRANGDPGAGSNIQIRGANTIKGDGSPLIIVDGIPISNEAIYDGGGNEVTGGSFGGVSQQSRLNDINPNDIASIQILKGASAGSLWGSRAANGVIVITTKKGQAGKLNVEYGFTYSIDEINVRHELQTGYGNGTGGRWRNNNRNSWGDRIADRSGAADEINSDGGYFEAPNGNRYFPITQKNSQEIHTEDNFNEIFHTGSFTQHNLSLSGGGEKGTFFISLGALNQGGIIRESFYDRYNARFNGKYRFNDWLSASVNSGYTGTKSNRIQQSSNVSGLYLGLLRTPPDFDNTDYIGDYVDTDGSVTPFRQRSYRRSRGESGQPTYNNPLWTINEQRNTADVDRFIFSTEFNLDPTEWFRFTVRGGIDDYKDYRIYFFPQFSSSSRSPGVLVEDVISKTELNLDAVGKANFRLTDEIGLSATLGWNINDRRRQFNSTNLTGFSVNSRQQTFDLNTDPTATTVERTLRNIRSNRGFVVLNFDLFDELFVNGSYTAEAASSLDGTFYYPAFDLAWQFKDRLLPNVNWFTFGKLRASWGKVGVQPDPHRRDIVAETAFDYSTYSDELQVARVGGGFRLDDDQGDADIRPEIKTEWEIGADMRFFDDRLGFSLTYYQNEIKDLIFDIPVTPSSGVDTKYTNGGRMQNKGLEAEIDYAIVRGGDWDLNFFANFNRNRNEVLELGGVDIIRLSGSSTISSNALAGRPLGALWGSKAVRNDDGSLFLDDNGFPVTDTELGYLGDPNAKWRGGAGFNFRYKNFSLNALIEHSQGGIFADRTRIVLYAIGTHGDTGNEITLTEDIKNVNGEVFTAGTLVRGNIMDWGAGPVLLDEAWYTTRGGGFGSGIVYDLLFPDATWTRLREISLSYRLKSSFLEKKLSLTNLEFTITGRNLFLWTDVKGIDPETNVDGVTNGLGIDYFTNPGTRSFLFALKANF